MPALAGIPYAPGQACSPINMNDMGMMNYSIEKVCTLTGAHRYGDREATIGFLLTDSRLLLLQT